MHTKALAAGVLLGLAARLVDEVAPTWVGNVGAVWFMAAFLVGRSHPNRVEGARAGVACLALACLTYYAWRVSVDGTISTRYLFLVGGAWLVASLVTGVVGGALGSMSTTSASAWAIAAGVLVGEATAVLVLSGRLAQPLYELAAAWAVSMKPEVRRHFALVLGTAAVIALLATIYRFMLR
jgi:hypothetical protein